MQGTADITGTGNILNNVLTGNAGNNSLTGSSGNDTIDGGAGSDTMIGGAGDDTYVVDNVGDVVTENVNEGTDIVQSSVSYTLSANVENLTLTGTASINGTGNDDNNSLTGNSGNNVLTGGAGNDTLNGGAGTDTMLGGAGDDTYVVDNAGDVVTENLNEGTDTVQSSVSYTLSANVENLTLTGAAAINGTGNELNNVITGNNAANVLDGGLGADTMAGGTGNDTYYVDNAGDIVTEGASAGTDTVISTVSYVLPDNVENLTLTGAGLIGTGNALNNIFTISDASDVIVEAVNGGTDTVYSSVSYTLGANVENLTLTGTAAIDVTGNDDNNVLTGNDGNNVLTGGAGNDTLNGGAGTDTMIGGAGDDTYVVDNAGDVVTENLNEGTDTVQSSVSYTLSANVENLTLTGPGTAINGTGNELNNVITGNNAANVLDGGLGADTMAGGTGNDTYYVDNAGDIVTEGTNAGTDTVYSTVSYVLPDNVENLVLQGTADITGTGNILNNVLTGNAGNNSLTGSSGNDTIDGGAGSDTMIGGAGNDTYVVDNVGDVVTENLNEGTDIVQSSVTYTLSANVENLTLTGTASINGTGNELNNVITGNSAADTLTGGLGDDTYVIGNVGDVVIENVNEGTDTVQSSVSYTLSANVENLTLTGPGTAINGTGNELNNVITGNNAANVLDGGLGADTMAGGTGNDTYYVDNAGDIVTEGTNAGTDTVYSTVSYVLPDNVENLVLQGTADITGTGNILNNVLTGNAGNNSLTGSSGNDTIDGGAGSDTMIGGAGNDTYVVDNVGDVVTENLNEGTDIVQSSVTYTLSANVENLTLTGTASINGTGNELNNVITGNSAADTLTGGLGDDTYVIGNVGDVVIENVNEGTDTVQSSVSYTLSANVENLTLTGPGTAINGTGNELNNVITGNNAANVLDGGLGADTMAGGTGNDTYYVDNAGDIVTEGTNAGTDTVYSTVSYVLPDNVENLVLQGTADITGTGNILNNVLTGNAGNNSLTGSSGNDTIDGGAGSDTMIGGAGNDTYVVDNVGDVVTENLNEGTDIVQSSVTYTLSANVENLTLTGTASINGTGNELNNVITGNSAADTLTGGLGDDTYVIGNVGDVVIENVNEGTDTVQSSVSYTLSANVENLTLTGSGTAINGTGNELNNVITGNNAANVLDGGLGADTMAGGTGNDTYYVDNAGDVVVENANQGTDTVISSISYTLGANVENLTLTGTDAIDATGNTLNNVLTGNSADNILRGDAGVDTLISGDGNDLLNGGLGNDVLNGDAGNDVLEGADGNDTLSDTAGNNLFNGGAGTDILTGSTGNELFIGSTGNDTITTGTGADIIAFNQGDGQDTVVASTGADNTLSLGGGINYQGLTMSKSGSDLILATGNSDQITLQNWYSGTGNHSVANLQLVLDASTYNASSTDPLLNQQVQDFDFAALAQAFDQALAGNPTLTAWSLTDSLLSAHLAGSDTAALGGDLAYQYNLNGTLAGIGLASAQTVINDASFGVSAQQLHPLAGLQTGTARLG